MRSRKPSAPVGDRQAAGHRHSPLLLIAVFATLAVLASLVVGLLGSLSTSSSERASQRHSALLRAAATLIIEVSYSESGERGFLLTGNDASLATYEVVQPDIPKQLQELFSLSTGAETPLVTAVKATTLGRMTELSHAIELAKVDPAAARKAEAADQARGLMQRLGLQALQLEQSAQDELHRQEHAAGQARTAATAAVAVGGVFSSALLGLLMWLFAQRRKLTADRSRGESARQVMLAELSRLATHDPLTELPNRRLAAERLNLAVEQAVEGHVTAVFIIDLDQFKMINDKYGHPRGDRCWSKQPAGCGRRCGQQTCWQGSAATNSWRSARTSGVPSRGAYHRRKVARLSRDGRR